MHRGAHAAEALGEQPGIAWVAAAENLFDAAPHGARSPCIADRIVVDFDIDAKVAFNSGYGVNCDSLCHECLLLVGFWFFVVAEISILEISGPANVRSAEPEVAC